MSYRGTTPPQIRRRRNDGTFESAVTLPIPKAGGRTENWVNLTETYENIDGELMAGAPKFRFEAEYEWGIVHTKDGDQSDVPGGLIDKISQLYNNGTSFNLIPHSDIKFVNYDVIVDELEIPKMDGIVYNSTLKIKLKGVRYVKAIPTIDNMLGCVFYNRIFGLED